MTTEAERSEIDRVDLAPYVARVVLDWQREAPGESFREIEGTLVFVDLSGFTAMSERLSKLGRRGAEEVTDIIGSTFAELLAVAYAMDGSLLKFGGDALLLFFTGDDHAARGCHAGFEMRRTLRRVGRIKTSAGQVSLRMSMGVHSGPFHFFLVGGSHRELIVTGPAASTTVAMEAAASAGEVVISPATAAALGQRATGEPREGGYLLARDPHIARAGNVAASVRRDVDPARFVPAAVRAHLSAGGSEPEHRTATVAFLHFDGLDELMERGGPAEVAARLRCLVEAVQAEVDADSVTFLASDVDHDGGKIILVAGAPFASGNDEDRMLHAVQAIAAADHGLSLRIGVHRGPVFAGDVGPGYRRTYTIMGDTVNTAARVMMHAAPGQVLVTEAVLQRCATTYEIEELAPFAAKGKAKPLVAFRLGGVVETTGAMASPAHPLHGRDTEVDVVLEAIGNGEVLEIIGDAGMGKTRLLQEVLRRLPRRRIVVSECQPYEEATAYFAVRPLLRELLDIDSGADAAQLAAAVERIDVSLSQWLPLIGAVVGIVVPSTQLIEQMEGAARRQRLHDVVTRLVRAAVREPTLWIVEDAHWIDSASRELLTHLARPSSAVELAVVVSERARPEGRILPDEAGPVLQLTALEAAATTRLAREVSASALLPNQLRTIVDRSGGNPLYLQELARALLQGADSEALPDSIESLIAARIDRLPPPTRNLLRHLAALGPTFDVALVADVSRQIEMQGTADLRSLTDFIEVTDRRARFKSAVFQEAAYAGLPYKRRVTIHQTVGQLIEARATDPEDEAEVLSLHFERAGDDRRTWRYSTVAGERAAAALAHGEAVSFLARATRTGRRLPDLPPLELGHAWFRMGQEQFHAGSLETSQSSYRQARRLLTGSPTALANVCFYEGETHKALGRYDAAYRCYRRGLRHLGAQPDFEGTGRLLVRLLGGCGTVRTGQGRHADSVKWYEQALVAAEQSNDVFATGQACNLVQVAYHHLGDRRGRSYGERAVDLLEACGAREMLPPVLNNLANMDYRFGDWDAALATYESAAAAAAAIGEDLDVALVTNNVADILANRGQHTEAVARYEDALAVARAAHSGYEHFFRMSLGRVLGLMGEHDEAAAVLDEARAGIEGLGLKPYVLQADLRRAENFAAAGRPEDAAACLPAEDEVLDEDVPSVLRVRALIDLELGKPDQGRQTAEMAVERSRAIENPYETAAGLEVLRAIVVAMGEDASELTVERDAIYARLGFVGLSGRLSDATVGS